MHVTSRQNPVVKRFRDVARAGRMGEIVLIDGSRLVGEALEAGIDLEIVAFAAELAEQRFAGLMASAAAAGGRVVTAPASLIGAMSPVKQASGVVALARLRPSAAPAISSARPPQLVLMLDGVQDPGNVGAIVRVAEACGGTGVIAGPGTADPLGWKAIRGSMGSAFRMPLGAATSVESMLDAAREAGLRIFATVPRGGTPVDRADLVRPSAILLGGEGPGLAQRALDAADETLTVPMRPPVESLNVSIAAALVVYEAARQRTHVAV